MWIKLLDFFLSLLYSLPPVGCFVNLLWNPMVQSPHSRLYSKPQEMCGGWGGGGTGPFSKAWFTVLQTKFTKIMCQALCWILRIQNYTISCKRVDIVNTPEWYT